MEPNVDVTGQPNRGATATPSPGTEPAPLHFDMAGAIGNLASRAAALGSWLGTASRLKAFSARSLTLM